MTREVSTNILTKIMEAIIHVCGAFDLTVSEKEGAMFMPVPHLLPVVMAVEAAVQQYRQTQSFT